MSYYPPALSFLVIPDKPQPLTRMSKRHRLRFIHNLLTRLKRDYTIVGDYVIDYTYGQNRFANTVLIHRSGFMFIDNKDQEEHIYQYIFSTEIEMEDAPEWPNDDRVESIYRRTMTLQRQYYPLSGSYI